MESGSPTFPQVTASVKRGGRRKAILDGSQFIRLKSERDVRVLAARTITQVRSGQIDYKIGQTIATLCNVALAAMRQGNEVALRLGAGKDNNYRVRRIVELEAAPSGDSPSGNKETGPVRDGGSLKTDHATGGGVR